VKKIGNNKINKKISSIYLSPSEKKHDIVYKCPRKGLSIKSNSDSNWEEFIMKPYRYFLCPKNTKKGRDLLTLGLIYEKYNNKDSNEVKTIINELNNSKNYSFQKFNEKKIKSYISAYKFGVDLKKQLPSVIEENLFKYPKCILYGLLKEGEEK
jgi:hypothetical protein